ncbi:MAG: glycerate kinase [Eubacteriales bacterium]|nr:glycerate kinase [Eubacteriales bacterium]MDD3866054.1 glycerate kinase [Eubacteriales bacterium]MDD4461043.1 glycerate kinase [Eubacteriales bacterium]
MRILIAPDSYKGSLTARQAADCIARAAARIWPEAQIDCLPLADGGEGTAAILTDVCRGRMVPCRAEDPLGRLINTEYGLLPDQTAVIEMASASGLMLLGDTERKPLKASTTGTGQLIADALRRGCRKIILTIGGSATNDGGMGALHALGVRFLDGGHETLSPQPENLLKIHRIDLNQLLPEAHDLSLTILCDVSNPLLGPAGATAVYGPQKGVDTLSAPVLEQGLTHLADCLVSAGCPDMRDLPGAGAAGGLGFGLCSVLNGTLSPGLPVILDYIGFSDRLAQADLVVTGEGQLDHQSLQGKVVGGLAEQCRLMNRPMVVLPGSLSDETTPLYEAGIAAIMPLSHRAQPLDQLLDQAAARLEDAAIRMFALILTGLQLNLAESDEHPASE